MTDIVGNRTLLTTWDDLARFSGDKTFLVFQAANGDVREYTYRYFDEEINRAANAFLAAGVEYGEVVAVQLCNSPEFLLCLFGLAKIGAVMVPMNEQYMREESEYCLRKTGASMAVVEEKFLQNYVSIAKETDLLSRGLMLARAHGPHDGIPDFEEVCAAQPTVLRERRSLGSNDLAEIMFTSGTTSYPKGVMVTHANMLYAGLIGNWQAAMRTDDRLLTTMPACHSNYQLSALMPVLTMSATLIMIEKYSASHFWQQIRDYRATITQSVSMIIRTLLLQPVAEGEKDHSLRVILHFLPMALDEKEGFERRFGTRIMNMYGSTESIAWVLTDPPGGPSRWPSIGRAALSYEIKLVDENGCEVANGEVGEIAVKGVPGRSIMRGYYRDPVNNEKTMKPGGWLLTGDKGRMEDDGWFFFVDRKSNMIKRAGENISATEVENVLEEHPAISEAAVIGVADPVRDQAVKAFIKLMPDAELSADEAIAYCKEHLASFKVPTIVEFCDDFPRTCSMKIEKHVLEEREAAKAKQ